MMLAGVMLAAHARTHTVRGLKRTDHFRSMALAELALDYAEEMLGNGGVFLCKFFRGPDEHELMARAKGLFGSAKVAKPPSSRSESREAFLLAREFHGSSSLRP